MDEIEIGFDEITEGDIIRTVRTDERVTVTVQGDAEWQDEDGDWRCGDELLTYQDSDFKETYFLLGSALLPKDPGSVITWDNYAGRPIFALKLYGEGWYASFSDGSHGILNNLHVSRKDWEEA